MFPTYYARRIAPKLATSAFYIVTYTSLSQGQELPYLTLDMFNNITNDKLVTEDQKSILFSALDDFFSFNLTPSDQLRMIAEEENIPIERDYIIEFKGENQEEYYHHKGLVHFSYQQETGEYIFKLYAFNDPNLIIKGTPYRGRMQLSPNIKAELNDGFFGYSSREEYKNIFKKLASTAICSYTKEEPTLLVLRDFSIHPYLFMSDTDNSIRMKGQDNTLKFEGFVAENINNRINKMYDLLGCFAYQFKMKEIIFDNNSLKLPPIILKRLTTKGNDGSCFLESKLEKGIYHLITSTNQRDDSKEENSEESL